MLQKLSAFEINHIASTTTILKLFKEEGVHDIDSMIKVLERYHEKEQELITKSLEKEQRAYFEKLKVSGTPQYPHPIGPWDNPKKLRRREGAVKALPRKPPVCPDCAHAVMIPPRGVRDAKILVCPKCRYSEYYGE